MRFKKETTLYRTFLASICAATILIMCGIFWWDSRQDENLIQEQYLSLARAQFNTIALVREWNSRYGGLYVEKKNGITSNPLLEAEDITTTDHRVFTKKNHAVMTRELSDISLQKGASQFRITSLRPLDSSNVPDPFDEGALKAFGSGARERFALEKRGNRTTFRYMAPLFVTQECLSCHAEKGFKIGQPLGGMSVSFDVEEMQNKLDRNTLLLSVSCGLATGLLLLLLWRLAARLMKRLAEARSVIEELAITDGLTRIYNRRHLTERFEEEFERGRRLNEHLACIVFDVDRFKLVNDSYGHQRGDATLKMVAEVTLEAVRSFDVVGRLGGDEFIIVLPETDLGEAVKIAERVRTQVEKEFIVTEEGERISVTLSLGVAEMRVGDISIESIIKRADESLYNAKREGRNRVGTADKEPSSLLATMIGACGRKIDVSDGGGPCEALSPFANGSGETASGVAATGGRERGREAVKRSRRGVAGGEGRT